MGSVRSPRALIGLLHMWSWREESNLQPAVYKTAALPLSYASARGLALCMVAYFTTGNTTSPVSLRGAQRPLAVIARLTQSAEAISLQRWSRGTGLLRNDGDRKSTRLNSSH